MTEKTAEKTFVAGEQLLDLVISGIRDEQGAHIETALATLSALAGFATQMALREALIVQGGRREDEVFKILPAPDGWTYYLSSEYFRPLLQAPQGHVTIYVMALAGAAQAGATSQPDKSLLEGVVHHAMATMGTPKFGIPRLPVGYVPRHNPADLLRDSWDTVLPLLKLKSKGNPLLWPFLAGEAVHLLMARSKDRIDADALMPIYLECAIPMAHIDPKRIVGQAKNTAADFTRSDLGKLLQDPAFKAALDNSVDAGRQQRDGATEEQKKQAH